VHAGLIQDLGLRLSDAGNVVVRDYMTSESGVFAAGDTSLGASLVVRAIYAGREAAAAVNRWLTGAE
jgi:NADPH-dependent glutamate synthase beta subunit-like oxidoreductase